ncbi:MAG: haloacid dehalogenase-like hydrolase [Oligoflexia bacterium]|nr:haloacid dehalogenase-like hydrolase [Oligoflexia bacterium]
MYKWFDDVKNAINILCEKDGYGKAAVFDADGTLWPQDLGEAFFQYQIKNQLAPGLKTTLRAWEQYLELDKKSTADANAWIVKLNAGLKLSELRKQAKEFYESNFKTQFNPLMKELIEKLKNKHYNIWICSASMRWAIEPALYELDLDLENLIGTECEISPQGILTKTIITPIPYAAGKKDALKKKLNSPPCFVVGNSLGDLSMLEWATDFPLVVQYLPGLTTLRGSERALRNEAEVKGWAIQIFQ